MATREEVALQHHLEVWKICPNCLKPATVIPGRHISFEGWEPSIIRCFICGRDWSPKVKDE